MSIFNINPMPDDEENTDIPPYVPQNEIGLAPDNHNMPPVNPMHPATTQPAGDIKLNNRPEIPYQDTFAPEPMQSKANVVPTSPPNASAATATATATPAPKQKPALSEFEQYKQMYPDDAIQKYVDSFRPNPNDDRSARFAKYAKLNAIGQGLTAIANLVGASHGAKIYAPQQNNTTQQLIGAAEQEKAKQEAKEEKYNLMKYQSALNTLNGFRTYKAASAKQNHEDEQNKLTRESNENIAKNHDATSVNNTEANNATSKYVSDNNNKSAERRSAASNATALEVAHISHAGDAEKKDVAIKNAIVDSQSGVNITNEQYSDILQKASKDKEFKNTCIDLFMKTTPGTKQEYDAIVMKYAPKYYNVNNDRKLEVKPADNSDPDPLNTKTAIDPVLAKKYKNTKTGQIMTRYDLAKRGLKSDDFLKSLNNGWLIEVDK